MGTEGNNENRNDSLHISSDLFCYPPVQETNISPPQDTFEGDFPFSMVGYFSFLKGRFFSQAIRP